MRALVTGSTGLLGSNLTRALLAEGWQVRAVVRSPHKAAQQLGDLDVEIVQGDLADIDGLCAHLDGVDVVFHTAAYFREYFGDEDHEAMLQALNVDATVALARAAHAAGVRRFVHTSSSGTIKTRPDGAPSTEVDRHAEHELVNRYFASKVRADEALEALLQEIDLDLVTVLPGWMFAPGDAAPTAAGGLVQDAIDGRLPPLALPGGTAVADARDVAAAMVRMATEGKRGEHYIVAGRGATLTEVISALSTLTGHRPPLFTLPYPLALAFAWLTETVARLRGTEPLVTTMSLKTLNSRHRLSSAKAESELGATFRPLDETLADTVAWFQGRASA